MKRIIGVVLVLMLCVSAYSVTIFEDNFDDQTSKVAGWDRSSTSYVTRYTGSFKKGVAALRLRYNKYIVTYLKVSPFKNMKLYFKMAAYSFERGEKVTCQYSTGGSWVTAKVLYNGSDNGAYRSYVVSIPNCTILKIRFIVTASSTADYAYIDDIKLVGDRK